MFFSASPPVLSQAVVLSGAPDWRQLPPLQSVRIDAVGATEKVSPDSAKVEGLKRTTK